MRRIPSDSCDQLEGIDRFNAVFGEEGGAAKWDGTAVGSRDEANNMAVLSVVGALFDEIIAAEIIPRDMLACRIDSAAAAHEDAGRADVAETIRWLSAALLDEKTLMGLSLVLGKDHH